MPVSPNLPGKVCLVVCCLLLIFSLPAQTLIGGSIYDDEIESMSYNHVWLQYANTFRFKEDMSIDSDFGHIFYTGNNAKRLNVRSTFKYNLTENLQIGAGMGFFWMYNTPNLSQELRFNQVISYFKDFERSTMHHDFQIEERLLQSQEELRDSKTRLRYRFGYTIPTGDNFYFGVFDEIFSHLNPDADEATIHMNRAGAYIGYNTHQFFRLEAHVMMQDEFLKNHGLSHRAWVFQVRVKQII
ncbi:MAG: DUF2490 domain-containing protein [Saprospiraceae bacterium]|nr:DUF2490 domain-containing protein [Saprospiraceae bacterium]